MQVEEVYYIVKEDGIFKIALDTFWENDECIGVFKMSEWDNEKILWGKCGIWHSPDEIHFCKMESHKDFLYGTFQVPSKEYGKKDTLFAIYILKNRVIILSDDDNVDKNIVRISGKAVTKDYSIERFIYDFFVSFIDEDLLFLQKIEHKITEIEEDIMKEQSDKFNIGLLRLKKIIARFYHYYTQLVETGDELAGNEEEFFSDDIVELFKMYSEKMTRLAQETQILREYAMQVQDVYQSEIEIHQNDVMKMLTIVTTIFLPLTLIAGWYGMNFSYMPELKMKYAYPFVIGISVLIVVVSLIVFKRKKYW